MSNNKASAQRSKLEKEPLLADQSMQQPQEARLTEAEARLLIATQKVRKKRNLRNNPAYKMLASYCWDRPRMTLSDTMLLSPWQKWKKYNRIPWKVVLHALLFIVVATQILLAYVETSEYTRASHNTFEALFIGGDGSEDSTDITFHTMDELLVYLNNTVQTYYGINYLAVDVYMHRHLNGTWKVGDPVPVRMAISSYTEPFFRQDNSSWVVVTEELGQVDEIFWLTLDNPFGAFNETDPDKLQERFHRLIKMVVSFELINLDVGVLGPIPFLWDIKLECTKTAGELHVNLNIDKEVYYTNVIGIATQDLFTVFNCLVFGLAFISFVFSLRGLFSNFLIYIRTSKQYRAIPRKTLEEEGYPRWEDIEFSVKFEFFSLWTIHILLTSLCLMLASILGIVSEFGYRTSTAFQIFEGLGALGASVNILRYLEYYEHFYTLILTLRVSGLRITRFIISAFPIFFGYMLMGIILFAPYSVRFKDLNFTAISLFALLNGDDIRSTFEQLNDNYPYPIVPTIYLYTFIALFITAILNIFIFIIEDSYHIAKQSKRTQQQHAAAAHGQVGGGHSHEPPGRPGIGTDVSSRRERSSGSAQEHNREEAARFGIFELFNVLDREFNANVEDDTGSASDSDTSNSDSSDSDSSSSSSGKGKSKGGHKKLHKHKKVTFSAPAAGHEGSINSGPEQFDEQAESSSRGRGLLPGLDVAQRLLGRRKRSDSTPLTTLGRAATPASDAARAAAALVDMGIPPVSRLTGRELQEFGLSRSDTQQSFDFKITYKKLKRDLRTLVDAHMDNFEAELDRKVEELKVKHRTRLQRQMGKQLKKSFSRLLPLGGMTSWEPLTTPTSSFHESPF